MKRKSILIFVVIILCLSVNVFAEKESIIIYLNRRVLKVSSDPIVENGTTLVPMRNIFEALGMTVNWDAATKSVTGMGNGVIVKFIIGNDKAYVNDSEKKLPVSAKIVNGNTMVPLRFISESVGCDVSWDGAEKKIVITTSDYTVSTSNEGDIYMESTDKMASLDRLYVADGADKYTGYKMLKGYPGENKFQIYFQGNVDSYMATYEDLRYINLDEVISWAYKDNSYKNTRKDLYEFFSDTSWFRSNLGIDSSVLSHDWFMKTFGEVYGDWMQGIAYSNDASRLVGEYLGRLSGVKKVNRYETANMEVSKVSSDLENSNERNADGIVSHNTEYDIISNDWITEQELESKNISFSLSDIDTKNNIIRYSFYSKTPYKKIFEIEIPNGWKGNEIVSNKIRVKKNNSSMEFFVEDLIKVGIIKER